jgi:hypothetical protein
VLALARSGVAIRVRFVVQPGLLAERVGIVVPRISLGVVVPAPLGRVVEGAVLRVGIVRHGRGVPHLDCAETPFGR